jgi:hypothetical protein
MMFNTMAKDLALRGLIGGYAALSSHVCGTTVTEKSNCWQAVHQGGVRL